MGLFDVFKSEPIKLNPYLSLAVGLLYMMAADGQIEDEEVGQLRTVFGKDDAVIQTALKYLRSNTLDQFLSESAACPAITESNSRSRGRNTVMSARESNWITPSSSTSSAR